MDNHLHLQTTTILDSGCPWATVSKCDLSITEFPDCSAISLPNSQPFLMLILATRESAGAVFIRIVIIRIEYTV